VSGDLPKLGQVSTTRVDNLEVRVVRAGPTTGIPVLLTNPWPESIYAFRGVLPAIERSHPVIAVDLPGFGRSEGRPDAMSPEAMGRFIAKLAEHFGMNRLHAVGPDVGTSALLFAAAQKPTLFESLTVGSGAASPELTAGALKDIIATPPGAFLQADGGGIATSFVTDSAARPPPAAVLEDYRLGAAGSRFEAQASYVRAYAKDLPRLKELLPNIQTPVLILAGKSDPIVPPANGQFLKDRLPRSQFTLLEGGHLVWEDAAQEYADHVVTWLGGTYRSV
jgi:pimeloyl-ACP methyl ester carboxylesterase